MSLRLLLALSFALVPVTASAAPAAPAAKATAQAAPRTSTSEPVRLYEFLPDDIEGEILSPDGVDVDHRAYGDHPSLIKVRTHFIPHMLKMADDV